MAIIFEYNLKNTSNDSDVILYGQSINNRLFQCPRPVSEYDSLCKSPLSTVENIITITTTQESKLPSEFSCNETFLSQTNAGKDIKDNEPCYTAS